jgi:DnaJ-class molecular chaperone
MPYHIRPFVTAERNGVTVMTCLACEGTGKYWRPDIRWYWPCNICLGKGYVPLEYGMTLKPHPEAQDRPYKGAGVP